MNELLKYLFEIYLLVYNTKLPMKEKKQERDAHGRFVKSTEPKKQEIKKSPCKSITPDVDKEIEELKAKCKMLNTNIELLKKQNANFRQECIEETCRANSLNIAFTTQRSITYAIIEHLNWFQRRKLRKELKFYPNDIKGYLIEKDV